MFFKSVVYLTTTAAAFTGGYVVLQHTAPAAAAKITGLLNNHIAGWDKEACERDPAGCLENRFAALQDLEKKVDHSIRTIREQKDRITLLVEEQRLMVAKNSSFLSEGRGLYKANEPTPGKPVEFAGKTYPNNASFKQQLALLFQEKAGLESNLKDAASLEKKLGDRLDNLLAQSGSITLAKRLIPAQIELVKANTTLVNFGDNVDMINGVITGSEAGLKETEQLMRTTKDLIAPSAEDHSRPKVSDSVFEDYMAR